jgi:putative DNA primase/helicase
MDDSLPPDLEEKIGAHKTMQPADSATDARPPPFSAEALALQFAEVHENDLRYVAAWGQWFVWDGARWSRDDTLKAFDHARQMCRKASAGCNEPRIAQRIADMRTAGAVERGARADRRLAATTSQWDADLWLLNTPGGTVNLKTGELRKHQPEDYCTKMTAVTPGGECPLWLSTLNYIFGGNTDLVSFLQRWSGYSLTGVTIEQKLVFEHGTGGNGKGVTTGTTVGVMGDYAMTAPMETFTASKNPGHPTELAMLRGARLVTASETEDGRACAESRIKQMTGGDPITARFMNQNFFTYTPQFKLLVAGNHKPSFRGVDEAIRRRFLLLPFLVTVPEADRDLDLAEKLKAEWPGILAWMIAGCLDWQKNGLIPPATVLEATKTYLDSEDALRVWLSDATTSDPNAWEATKDLFSSWTSWAIAAGEQVGSEKRFAEALEGARYVRAKNREQTKRGFKGIKLNRPELAGDPRYAD